MILIGYARVSTDDQKLNLQQDALHTAGCEKIFEDYLSGARATRPGLTSALEMARSGDTLVVWRLDRLGRSLKDLIQLTETLKQRSIGLQSLHRQRLDLLLPRCLERKLLLEETANLYGISKDTLYRLLRAQSRPKSLPRADRGQPRKLTQSEMESYCEVIAAFKIRTSNKKGRHISTTRAIELLEKYGVDTPNGFVQPAPGLLTKTTVNRYLQKWGYDQERMTRQLASVRFQADNSNDCWHFDLSPSDLKHIANPAWVEPGRGNPLLQPHRESPHSRVEDWLQNIPKDGLKAMCSWEKFCTFAREPQRRKVGGDARVSLRGDKKVKRQTGQWIEH